MRAVRAFVPQPGRTQDDFPTQEKLAHGYQTFSPDLHWVPLSYLSASTDYQPKSATLLLRKWVFSFKSTWGSCAPFYLCFWARVITVRVLGLFTTAHITRGAAPQHGPLEQKPTSQRMFSHSVAAQKQISEEPTPYTTWWAHCHLILTSE